MRISPLDPDREEARRILSQELTDPAYQLRESLLLRAWRWITDRLPSLDISGSLPSWTTWVVLLAVLVAAAAIIAFATRDRWTRARQAPHVLGAVLDEVGLSAADYRARAAAAAARGDHGGALLDGYRALAAGAVERTLVPDRPGATAHEVAVALAPSFPDQAPALTRAADAFDAVRYGGRRAAAETARAVLDLERAIATGTPRPTVPWAASAWGGV